MDTRTPKQIVEAILANLEMVVDLAEAQLEVDVEHFTHQDDPDYCAALSHIEATKQAINLIKVEAATILNPDSELPPLRRGAGGHLMR